MSITQASVGGGGGRSPAWLWSLGAFGAIGIAAMVAGERVATVWLTTDSPITPQVELNLHIIGRRKPPYLQNVTGDLAFEGDADMGDVREIHSYNMENPRTPPTPATVENVPDILRVEPGRLVQVRPTADDSTVLRHYVYEVRLTGRPPQGRASPDLILIDPWDATNKHAVRAHVELEPPIRSIPARVVLNARPGDEAKAARQSVNVLSKDALPNAAAERHSCERCPLRISDVEVFDEGRMITFLVGLDADADAHAEGKHAIVIKSASNAECLTIPVMVRGGQPR